MDVEVGVGVETVVTTSISVVSTSVTSVISVEVVSLSQISVSSISPSPDGHVIKSVVFSRGVSVNSSVVVSVSGVVGMNSVPTSDDLVKGAEDVGEVPRMFASSVLSLVTAAGVPKVIASTVVV